MNWILFLFLGSVAWLFDSWTKNYVLLKTKQNVCLYQKFEAKINNEERGKTSWKTCLVLEIYLLTSLIHAL